MTPLKFGIIGCSRIAKKAVIPAIIKSEFAELEMIGSRTIDKSKEFSSEFNCKKTAVGFSYNSRENDFLSLKKLKLLVKNLEH